MSEHEARRLTDQVNNQIADTKQNLLRLHDEQGWAALGYNSWQEFCEAEIRLSRAHVYKLVEAARVRDNLLQNATGDVPDTHAFILSRVSVDRQAEIYETAKQTAPQGKLTAKHIRETAEDMDALPPKWGERGEGQSSDWGRGKSGRYELEQKLKLFDEQRQRLFLLSCAHQLGHTARWEVACEVEKAKDVQGAIGVVSGRIGLWEKR